MKKFLLALLLIPIFVYAGISDWDYMPYISYTGDYPGEMIKQGNNFDLLRTLWNGPQSPDELRAADFQSPDTARLVREGMIYNADGIYYSAVPFIDSLATENLRAKATLLAKNIIDDTQPEMNRFLSILDSAGYRQSAFPLVHSLVFDDIIWKYIGVTHEKATICPADSMTWSGVFYYYQPEDPDIYGTNGIGLGNSNKFKFAWGNKSNAYLCTVFIKTQIINALRNVLNDESLTDEMLNDCRRFGVMDENDRLTIPILDGQDEISKAANLWAKVAASSFDDHFDGTSLAETIGWNCKYNEAALKVILYHETLSKIDRLLDETGLLPIPEILKSEISADKRQTASVGYITL
ncbi:MAG: hypothetical protein K2I64_05605 [Muribaculaceae bacterium]|nr:hypothetical protein [Muribaculaceae bacterium]